MSVENDRMHKKGIYFEQVQWEYFLDAISTKGLQNEYNKALEECDIVVSLFFTKAGKYTVEELEKAYEKFMKTGKPNVFTYFKDAAINTGQITEKDISSLFAIKKSLDNKGHYYTSYSNIDQLKNKLKKQLELLGYYD